MSSTGSHRIPMHIHMSMMALKDVIIEMVLIMVIINFSLLL